MGQLIADRYELKEVVGSGGMSSVYCAHDTQLERNVALKILHDRYMDDEEYVDRFRREARAVAQLSHPNIVTVIDRGEEDGKQFIVFELVDGENLKELVERGGPLPVRRVLDLGLQIARALAFAHAQGLVHRDVKPQNVLLTPEGTAKVTDFGIARSIDAVGGHTQTGTVLGTSHYIAPEQARGERVDAQTDVYSFGVVLFELLTGDVPYPGDQFLTVAMRHVNDPVPSVLDRRPDAPVRLASLVERSLAKAPADRPASMDEVIAELQACVVDLDSRPAGDATMIQRAPVRRRRREQQQPAAPPPPRRGVPVLPFLLALLIVGAVAGALFLTRDDGSAGGEQAAGNASRPVELTGVASFDPLGDNEEHSERVADATDGDASTYWTTESYEAWTKDGVGLVLRASGGVSKLALSTDTPGFTAEIRAGSSQQGPFDEVVGESKQVGQTAEWELDTDARFLTIWITQLDRVAHVNEVEAS